MKETVERLRPVAQIPGFHGLNIAYIEQVADLVGQARQAIDEWGREVARRRPRSILHRGLTPVSGIYDARRRSVPHTPPVEPVAPGPANQLRLDESDAGGDLPFFNLHDHPLARIVVDLKFNLFLFLGAEQGGASRIAH